VSVRARIEQGRGPRAEKVAPGTAGGRAVAGRGEPALRALLDLQASHGNEAVSRLVGHEAHVQRQEPQAAEEPEAAEDQAARRRTSAVSCCG